MDLVNTTLDIQESTTYKIEDEIEKIADPSKEIKFLFVPLFMFASVIVLSLLVFLMTKMKRSNRSFITKRFVPQFTFDSSDFEDDDFTPLLRGRIENAGNIQRNADLF